MPRFDASVALIRNFAVKKCDAAAFCRLDLPVVLVIDRGVVEPYLAAIPGDDDAEIGQAGARQELDR